MNHDCKMRYKDDDGQWREVHPGDLMWPLVTALQSVQFWHVPSQKWQALDDLEGLE